MVECEVFFFFQLVHVLENDELSLYVNSPAEVRDDMFISILIQYLLRQESTRDVGSIFFSCGSPRRYFHFHFNTVFTSTGKYT